MLTPGQPPATLARDGIARRIPHQGNMCLLDEVTGWDAQHIMCQTRSHQASDNPLRAHGRLGAACGVEYAAQAMAVHGALMGEALAEGGNTRPRAGYLASVRSVSLLVTQLDTQSGPLTVSAERVTGDDNTALYSFELRASTKILLRGRAVVVLDAAALSAEPAVGGN
ncbi:MAG: hotdog family protein [Polaromonas sp.]|uniref:hotdog family protein n=1 Tax=Polaromonas sp. TaxID=1869339 RepID=UPI00272FF163|nr:hotdog family protein [Polaromonas sp.]MDP1742560.1 hotdog family protein [Polaromonas sp.]MDP1954928.1 hotdog family protein [Polaromonas sp.]MDP3354972.1 hotdog family protein [Polaromonas sp.]MDP3752435.1 hotdog family protein [Polaromonas sp.]